MEQHARISNAPEDAAPAFTTLSDFHCHLDFMANASEVAEAAAQEGCHIFANTVTPAGYAAARKRLAGLENVHLGLGLHPWYLSDAAVQLELFDELFNSTRFIGEVGLDFSKRKAETAEAQNRAFKHIAALCGSASGKVLSLHAIKAADAVLDALDKAGALRSCTCVFHWFSGSNEQLHRAIKAGCYFSVGPFMANSRRGREYLKVIPAAQLLFETDYPPTTDELFYDKETGEPRVPFSYAQLKAGLEEAAGVATQQKGAEIIRQVAQNAHALLGF